MNFYDNIPRVAGTRVFVENFRPRPRTLPSRDSWGLRFRSFHPPGNYTQGSRARQWRRRLDVPSNRASPSPLLHFSCNVPCSRSRARPAERAEPSGGSRRRELG